MMRSFIPTVIFYIFVVAFFVTGCVGQKPSFKTADCERFRYLKYSIIVCDNHSVGIYCAKGSRNLQATHKRVVPIADNGKIVDYAPRACYNPRGNFFNRKGNLIVGESYTGCIPHEICHIENPYAPQMCEDRFPCSGDRR